MKTKYLKKKAVKKTTRHVEFWVAMSVVALFCFSGCATTPKEAPMKSPKEISADDHQNLEDQWGVKVVSVRLTAANNLINMKYRMIDADKVYSMVKLKDKPYLVHQDSGRRFTVPRLPKVGSLASNYRKAGPDRTLFTMFTNVGQTIKRGDKITIVMGKIRIKDVVME